jgi:hypothetical protein
MLHRSLILLPPSLYFPINSFYCPNAGAGAGNVAAGQPARYYNSEGWLNQRFH